MMICATVKTVGYDYIGQTCSLTLRGSVTTKQLAQTLPVSSLPTSRLFCCVQLLKLMM